LTQISCEPLMVFAGHTSYRLACNGKGCEMKQHKFSDTVRKPSLGVIRTVLLMGALVSLPALSQTSVQPQQARLRSK
jgi:hypothetical protein